MLYGLHSIGGEPARPPVYSEPMPVSRPRVVMLVRNAMTHDSRVEKEADSLANAGYQVTVVAEA
jgi:hypothetical protein